MIGGNLYIGNNKIYIHNTALKWELHQATKLLTQFLLHYCSNNPKANIHL